MNDARPFELITMGRAIMDVYAEQVGCRLEEVASFARYVGGCPANIAIGTARLGLRTAMITRVGDEQNGRFLLERFVREGVDTSHVRVDPLRLTGVAFLGIRDEQTFPLLHYRQDCADMAIEPGDYSPEFIAQGSALLVSGSHLTTEKSRSNVAHAVKLAKANGTRVIFDIDYRPVFWGLVGLSAGESRYIDSLEATNVTQALLADCDLLVGTEEELHIAAGSTDTMAALSVLRRMTSAVIVRKRGKDGCSIYPGQIDAPVDCPGFPVDVFNVVGAGDGFLSGFLAGWLRGRDWAECGRMGNACGALVVSRHGCSPASPTKAELEWFLSHSGLRGDLHGNRELESLHRATTRRNFPARLYIVACDHTAPFENLPCAAGRTLAGFKSVVGRAIGALQPECPGLGLLLDDHEGAPALQEAGSVLAWVGRKLEQTGHAPLAFNRNLPATVSLREWPRHHIAKCLVPAACSDDEPLQLERLRELQHAADAYGIEFLLELVHEPDLSGLEQVCQRIDTIQRLGIRPDWWKLPAFEGAQAWSRLEAVIKAGNPHCHGILLLGAGREPAALAQAFRSAAENAFVRGFAVGRSLLMVLAAGWLSARIDDAAVQRGLREGLMPLIDAWEPAAESVS